MRRLEMKRASRVLAVVLVASAMITGVALAAASPTVATGAATKIGPASAVLTARINPNGRSTGFLFSYGLTTAYGVNSAARSAGHGSKTVDVSQQITGLSPGTVYHYRIYAQNASGVAYGADRTFTTGGPAPAQPVTGATSAVGKTQATPTGSVNPMSAPTNWTVQYGLTTAYGYESIPQPLAAVAGPLAVSAPLVGLAPATLFHYRVVAFHTVAGQPVEYDGADATFFTEPAVRPRPDLRTHIAPGTARRSPYTYTVSGQLRGAGFIPALQRCVGNVGIRFYNGRRPLAFVVAPVGADCRFSQQASFRHYHGHGATKLEVTIDYRGTGYLASVTRTDHVTAG
jgi:hypothetical protein